MVHSQASTDSEVEFEKRLTAYFATSLRRYASHWRQALYTRMDREAVTLNSEMSDRPSQSAELLILIRGADAAEEEYLQLAPLEEVLGNPAIYGAFQQLTPRQRRVLSRLVLEGQSQRVVAAELQVSQQAVHQTKEQALQRLRRLLQAGSSPKGRPADRYEHTGVRIHRARVNAYSSSGQTDPNGRFCRIRRAFA